MKTQQFIIESICQSVAIKGRIMMDKSLLALIARVAGEAVKILRAGGKILLAGNGGSAADSQHLAGELVNRFRFDRPALPAIALSTDTSVLTCIANDSSFKNIFARQIEALGKREDMFIGISTSGASANILKAFEACRKKKIISVGLTGRKGSKMARLCDYCMCVPADDTPRIQEAHITIGHIICDIIEKSLFGKQKR
jgi:D-sedoheptulose 7-phosphate isomerase